MTTSTSTRCSRLAPRPASRGHRESSSTSVRGSGSTSCRGSSGRTRGSTRGTSSCMARAPTRRRPTRRRSPSGSRGSASATASARAGGSSRRTAERGSWHSPCSTLTGVALPIEDYGLIGDTQTAALVGRDGSIDWLCMPRFDSPALFAALLGDESHGRWLLGPAADVRRTERRYRQGTLVLETDFHTDGGVLQVVDSMPIRDEAPDVVRVARCLEGRVSVRLELILRFDFGRVVPWVRRAADGGLTAIAGPDAVHLIPGRPVRGRDLTTVAEFELDT